MRKDVLFFTTLLISFSASATTIDFYSDASCQTSQNTVTVTEDLRNGTCYELSNTNSVNPVSVDASCAVTVYTGPYCTNDATLAPVGSCTSMSIGSYSVDCPNLSAPSGEKASSTSTATSASTPVPNSSTLQVSSSSTTPLSLPTPSSVPPQSAAIASITSPTNSHSPTSSTSASTSPSPSPSPTSSSSTTDPSSSTSTQTPTTPSPQTSSDNSNNLSKATTIALAVVLPCIAIIVAVIFGINQWGRKRVWTAQLTHAEQDQNDQVE